MLRTLDGVPEAVKRKTKQRMETLINQEATLTWNETQFNHWWQTT